MIVWLNGAFGVGKTSTARELARVLPDSRIFDPEYVGFMLRHVLGAEPVSDFQDWRPWRELVVSTATSVLAYTGATLIAPQTVTVRSYWHEIHTAFADAGIPVRHIVLHASRAELVRRIDTDAEETTARQWRLDHLDAYESARTWLDDEAEIIDTTRTRPDAIARRIAGPGAGLDRPTSR